MTGAEFLAKINDIDPELLSGADKTPVKKRHVYIRWLTAAVLVVLLGISAYAAASAYLIEKIDLDHGSGYTVTLKLPKVSQKKLTGEIKKAPAIIKEQYENYEMWSSAHPGTYTEKFDSAADAADFVGFSGLRVPYFPYDESDTTVTVMGTKSGDIEGVLVETSNVTKEVRVTVSSCICTISADEFRFENIYPEDGLEYTWSDLTTGSGAICKAVSASPLSSGYQTLTGYIVKGSVLYRMHLAFTEDSSDIANNMLLEWANSF